MANKVKITQKDFDDIYEIDDVDTTEIKEPAQKPEPEFLTQEEEAFDIDMHQDLNTDEEKQ